MRAICVQGGRGDQKKAEKLRAYYINGPKGIFVEKTTDLKPENQ